MCVLFFTLSPKFDYSHSSSFLVGEASGEGMSAFDSEGYDRPSRVLNVCEEILPGIQAPNMNVMIEMCTSAYTPSQTMSPEYTNNKVVNKAKNIKYAHLNWYLF